MWVKEDMAAAIIAVREKKLGYLKAAKLFNVPRSTLFRFVNDKDSPIDSIINKVIGRRPVFCKDIENALLEYLSIMETKFYGLTRMDLRRLAYQLALKNNIKNPFKTGFAGRHWLKGFLKRHQDYLFLRQSTETSQAHTNGFTKERMDEFYDNLEKIQSDKSFSAARIFNVDVSSLSIVQCKIPKIVARKGKKQIAAMTSAEKEFLITIVICMSAAGIFVPPMIIFPRKNMSDALMKGAPVGFVGKAHPSGWIQTHLFTEWFEHFVDYVKPTEASPVLLILDGHHSHTKNINLIDLAEEHNVTILSIPPHCTHKVQPLDRAFMGPLISYYSEEVRVFYRDIRRSLTPFDIAELFGKAYMKCQTGDIAANGFRVSGIYPFNRNVFTEADYITTAADLEESHNSQTVLSTLASITATSLLPENYDDPEPGSSGSRIEISSPFHISSLPEVKKRTSKRCRKSAKPYLETISVNDIDSFDDITIKDEIVIPNHKDDVCFLCDRKYSEDKRSEQWVQCLMCELWVHGACGGNESSVYICDFCRNSN